MCIRDRCFSLATSDNGLDAETHAKFLTSEYGDLSQELSRRPADDPGHTFFGGTPAWLQGSDEAPPSFQFAGMFAEKPFGRKAL